MKPIKLRWLAALAMMLALLNIQVVLPVSAELPIVRAVLFYSPSCPHCQHVINEVLPPLYQQYGDQLQIMGISTFNPEGHALYQAAIAHLEIPDGRRGVPTLILGEFVLVGSREIPEQLPVLIEQYLAEGGVDWPDFPGLAEALQAREPQPEATPEFTPDQATVIAPVSPPRANTDLIDSQIEIPSSDDLISKLRQDPPGNTLAILVLLGMLAVIGHVLRRIQRVWKDGTKVVSLLHDLNGWRSWVIALLCLVGLGISIYLAHIETTHTTAVCGPIGDCNTVQQSPYAVLFGLIPIGILGAVGYVVMLFAWAGMQWGQGRFKRLSEFSLLGMALFGTLFSIYLTFLEPFVIGATCMWCLTSAVSMTLILLVLAGAVSAHPEPAIQQARV